MKFRLVMAVAAVALLVAAPQSPDVRFRAAQQKETVEGDLQSAISMYRKLADDRSTPPEVAVRSLLRLGRCYERLGSTEARKAYERIIAQFSGQNAAVAEAKQLLAAMPASGLSTREHGVIVRKLRGDLRGYLSSTLTQDGRYAAITRGRTGLDVLDVMTGERKPVATTSPLGSPDEAMYWPAISPDGHRIVADVPRGRNSSELRVIDRRTGEVRTIVKSDTSFRLLPMDWSRDGRTILVRTYSETSPRLFLIDVDTRVTRPVPWDGDPEAVARLSPDGQMIAYTVTVSPYGRSFPVGYLGKIYIKRIDGSGDHLVAAPAGGAILAGWSPDGRHVLYISDDLGTDHLWAARIRDGRPAGEPVSVAKGLARGELPIVTASGSLVLKISVGTKCYTAFIDTNTGAITGREPVNANVNAMMMSAVWSPDGRRMVYPAIRRPGQVQEKGVDLYVREVGSAEDRKLGAFPPIPRKLSWTPDGKALIMPHPSGDGSGLFRYWLDEGRTEQLVPPTAGNLVAKAYPRLAPDGKTLYYLDAPVSLMGAKLIRYDLTTGGGTPIAVVNLVYDLAPDGEHLIVPLLDAASKQMTIQVITNTGQSVRELVRLAPDERVMSLAWAPDGKWIYFGKGTEAGVEIHRVPAAGGQAVFTGLRTSTFPDLVIHPNGNQIAFLDRAGTDLWRVDGIGEVLARLP